MRKSFSIIGYSGHSYVCIEAATLNGYRVEGYYDIEEKRHNPFNLKYLGKEDLINNSKTLFITIGNNQTRSDIYNKLSESNNLNVRILHPSSIISTTATIKDQVIVCAASTINSFVCIGKGCIINTGAIIDHECNIGDFTHIAPSATLLGNVTVGKRCLIGANAVLKQNITVGDFSVVGAGAVVLDDVPPSTIYVGNPAKKI